MAYQSNSRPVNPYIGTSYATFASIIIGLVIILVVFEQLGINNLWLGHVVLIVPILSYLVIGFLTRTVIADEFYVSGRRVPAIYNGLAYAGASFGGIGFFALTGSLFLIGYDALAIGLGLGAGLVLMAILFVPYLRKYGAYTLPSFLGERFESTPVRLIAAFLLFIPSMMLLSTEIRIAAEVISQFTATSFRVLIFICAGAIVLSNILGGMRSLTWTTGAQLLVVMIGMMTTLVILAVTHTTLPLPQLTYGSLISEISSFEAAGGIVASEPVELAKALPGENSLVVKKPMEQMFGAFGRVDFLFLMLSVMLGASVLPASLMRISTSVNVNQARRSIGWGVVLTGFLLMTIPAVAVFAKYILYNMLIGQPFNAMPHWLGELKEAGMVDVLDINKDGIMQVRELAVTRDSVALLLPIAGELPFVLVGFMAAGGMAAALAAGGAQMIAISNSVSEDLFRGFLWSGISQSKRLLVARSSMIVMTIIASLIAIRQDFDILYTGLWAFSIAASSFFAPLTLAIWWKNIPAIAIVVGMLTGFLVALLLIVLHWSGMTTAVFGIGSLVAAIAGVPLSFGAAVAVAYLRPATSDSLADLTDEIRIPDGETIHDYKERVIRGRGHA